MTTKRKSNRATAIRGAGEPVKTATANGHAASEPAMVLAAGLPRLANSLLAGVAVLQQSLATATPIPQPLAPQSNLVDLDSLAAELYRQGFCLWLRHDGEEFAVDLECGVDVLPASVPRPRGRGVTAAEAIAAAVGDKVKVMAELRKR